jgi:hypothetical protein
VLPHDCAVIPLRRTCLDRRDLAKNKAIRLKCGVHAACLRSMAKGFHSQPRRGPIRAEGYGLSRWHIGAIYFWHSARGICASDVGFCGLRGQQGQSLNRHPWRPFSASVRPSGIGSSANRLVNYGVPSPAFPSKFLVVHTFGRSMSMDSGIFSIQSSLPLATGDLASLNFELTFLLRYGPLRFWPQMRSRRATVRSGALHLRRHASRAIS